MYVFDICEYNIAKPLKMQEQTPTKGPLLDISDINNIIPASLTKSSPQCKEDFLLDITDPNISKNYKDFTHFEEYEEQVKNLRLLRKQGLALQNQYEKLQSSLIEVHLKRHIEDMKTLSQQNQQLRKLYHYESAQSNAVKQESKDKVRKSVNNTFLTKSIHQEIDSFNLTDMSKSKVELKEYHPRRSIKQNLMKSRGLTEKKVDAALSNNSSFMTDKRSQYQQARGNNHIKPNKNIFLELLESLLIQEKINQVELENQLNQEIQNSQNKIPHFRVNYLNQMEKQIIETQERQKQLDFVLQAYQREIKQMNENISVVQTNLKDLKQVKNELIEKEKQCQKQNILREQIKQKQQLLKTEVEKENPGEKKVFDPPASVKLLLKIVSENNNQLNSPSQILKELKKIFRNDSVKEKFIRKKGKIKELIDNFSQGNKKFLELSAIYENRIKKLQDKIAQIER